MHTQQQPHLAMLGVQQAYVHLLYVVATRVHCIAGCDHETLLSL